MEPSAFAIGIIWFIVCIILFVVYFDIRWIVNLLFRLTGLTKPRKHKRITFLDKPASFVIMGILTLCIIFCIIDAYFVEPGLLSVTRITCTTSKFSSGSPQITIAHLSDFHLEGWRALHDRCIARVNAEHPDLILLTGDYLNLSTSAEDMVKLLSSLKARYGKYTVLGNWDKAHFLQSYFKRAGVVNIEGTIVPLTIGNQKITVFGVEESNERQLEQLVSQLNPNSYNIMLTHDPDLIPKASNYDSIDLYLCGHTHGGQVRLPFYGAIITLSRTGKKYEMGLYRERHLQAYVTRGIGMEGGLAPRIRFLCPPEIVFISIKANK
ncbi:metallophosphoesterase [Candidatus Sumerlaeota bacterium]|nr:metallophosphoesterase [Candidatus Sumerlaeota bacterium]